MGWGVGSEIYWAGVASLWDMTSFRSRTRRRRVDVALPLALISNELETSYCSHILLWCRWFFLFVCCLAALKYTGRFSGFRVAASRQGLLPCHDSSSAIGPVRHRSDAGDLAVGIPRHGYDRALRLLGCWAATDRANGVEMAHLELCPATFRTASILQAEQNPRAAQSQS